MMDRGSSTTTLSPGRGPSRDAKCWVCCCGGVSGGGGVAATQKTSSGRRGQSEKSRKPETRCETGPLAQKDSNNRLQPQMPWTSRGQEPTTNKPSRGFQAPASPTDWAIGKRAPTRWLPIGFPRTSSCRPAGQQRSRLLARSRWYDASAAQRVTRLGGRCHWAAPPALLLLAKQAPAQASRRPGGGAGTKPC